jgi:hypothetical protein
LDLYTPKNDVESKKPCIVFCFGGSFVTGSRTSTELVQLAEFFTKKGYECASIDYRLDNFLNLIAAESTTKAVWRAVQDAKAAIRYLRSKQWEYKKDEKHIFIGGTSAAAPHVAGLAGLILSVEPELSSREVSDMIEKTARKIGGYTYNFNDPNHPNWFWHNEVGYGLVDAHNAVASVYCADTKLHNLTFNGTPSFSDCKILSNNSIVNSGKTTYTVTKKVLLNNNFEVKSDAPFEIKT